MTITPAPKPPAPEKKEPKRLTRRSALRSSSSPQRTKKIRSINPERMARVTAGRKQERKDNRAEHEAARQLAWDRARGVCECGCNRPMDVEGEKTWPGHPEFHHGSYRKGHVRGRYMRKECHQRIEAIHFAHRAARRRAA